MKVRHQMTRFRSPAPVRSVGRLGRATLLGSALAGSLALAGCSAAGEEVGRGPALSDGNEPTQDGDGNLIAPTDPTPSEPEDTNLVVDNEPEPTRPMDEDCDNILEVTYRDFSEDHPDFEMQFAGDVVRLQLVEAQLGEDKKPVFKSSMGCPPEHEMPGVCANWEPTEPSIASADTFAQWYRTEEGVNYEIPGTIELTPTAENPNLYVFDRGEFFPLGPDQGFGVTPAGHHLGKNFLFTTEIHLQFDYLKGQIFKFRGDDDLWIFVNDKLALDLGSMHNAEEGQIDFDAQAEALGITPGGSYSMDIFHAERHTTASNFKFETNISCFTPVVIKGAK